MNQVGFLPHTTKVVGNFIIPDDVLQNNCTIYLSINNG
jgi:hypothetical protein